MGKSTFWTERRVIGMALILGSVLFLTGASMPVTDSKGTSIYSLSPQEWLRVVYDHPTLWWWANVLMISGTVVALLGFALLTTLLRDAGNRAFSRLGLLTFELSAVFLIIHTSFHLSTDLWAAQETVRTAAMLAFYVPITLWVNAFFVICTALVLVAFAAYGGALVFTRVLPHWIGWTTIVYSIAVMGILVFTGDGIPSHPLLPLVMGILLLLRRFQVPTTSHQEPEAKPIVAATRG